MSKQSTLYLDNKAKNSILLGSLAVLIQNRESLYGMQLGFLLSTKPKNTEKNTGINQEARE
jgi:hypothetical protein